MMWRAPVGLRSSSGSIRSARPRPALISQKFPGETPSRNSSSSKDPPRPLARARPVNSAPPRALIRCSKAWSTPCGRKPLQRPQPKHGWIPSPQTRIQAPGSRGISGEFANCRIMARWETHKAKPDPTGSHHRFMLRWSTEQDLTPYLTLSGTAPHPREKWIPSCRLSAGVARARAQTSLTLRPACR